MIVLVLYFIYIYLFISYDEKMPLAIFLVDPLAMAANSAAALQGLSAPGSAAGLPGSLPFMNLNPSATAYNLAASQQLAAAAREQQMIYRELLSQPPYCNDPILAQQVRDSHILQHILFLGFLESLSAC